MVGVEGVVMSTLKKSSNGRDYSTIIFWSAMLVESPRWAGAFIASDAAEIPALMSQIIQVANMIAGVAMAPLLVMGSAYLLNGWSRTKPKKRANSKHIDYQWVLLTCFVFALYLMMPVILAPHVVARMRGEALADVLGGFTWVWSTAVVLAPLFLVGGVSVSQKELMTRAVPVVQETKRKPIASGKETERKRDGKQSGGKVSGRFDRVYQPNMTPTQLINAAGVGTRSYAFKWIQKQGQAAVSSNGVGHD